MGSEMCIRDRSHRRYRYGNQPQIGAWNIARMLEAISPLMDEPESLKEVLEFYISSYEKHSDSMWAAKLGFTDYDDSDNNLISELNILLQKVETDMTIFFRELCGINSPDISNLKFAFYDETTIPVEEWNLWLEKWWTRVDSKPDRELMRQNNPKYVLRNWMAQLAIDAAEKEDFSVCELLFDLLKSPYDEHEERAAEWYQKRPEWARHRAGCSMLSCSS